MNAGNSTRGLQGTRNGSSRRAKTHRIIRHDLRPFQVDVPGRFDRDVYAAAPGIVYSVEETSTDCRVMAGTTSVNGDDELRVTVVGSSDVKAVAREVLIDVIASMGADILDEASKYEATRNRPFTEKIDYSPSDIGQAASVVRNRGFIPKPRGALYVWLRVLQWILTLAAGLMGGLIPSWSASGYLLAISATAALAITAYLEYSDWEERGHGRRK